MKPPFPEVDQTPKVEPPPENDGLPLQIVRRDPLWVRTENAAARKRVWRRLRYVPLVMATLLTGAVIGMYFQPPGLRFVMSAFNIKPGGGATNPIAVPAPKQAASDAATRPRPVVVGLGKLLPDSDIITIAPPFGSGDARVAAFWAREGEAVAQGALLAVMDNERSLLAAVESAEALVAARDAALRQTRELVAANRDEARATLARAEAGLVNAKRELDRTVELRAKGHVTDATYDLKQAAYDQAAQDVARARATLSRFLVADIDAQADVELARRNADSARADHARARADLEKAYVRAPVAGTILTLHLRPGEKPGALGLMTMGDLSKMRAEVEVYQTQIGAVAVGAAVTLIADAFPQPLSGVVDRVGLEVGKQSLVDASPAANTDARVVKVYVALDDAASDVARRFSNLQVTARIAAKERQ